MSRISKFIRALLFLLVAGFTAQFITEIAEARAGGRRSMGRSSKPAQSEQYRQNQPSSQPAAAPQRGGFGRALAGGIAGGFLGSMLFSSIGNAAGVGGAGGGGIGLIEIILIAGLAFLAFRWWKARQMKTAMANGTFSQSSPASSGAFGQSTGFGGTNNNANYQAAGYNSGFPQQAQDVITTGSIDSEEASDIFFRIQGAFTRRDLVPVADRLSPDMYRELNRDIEDMKMQKRINRLENISVRRVDITDRWNEGGAEHARVRFSANLLDYVVDETSGQVIEGSANEPVKFEEDWTFARTTGYAPWQLVGISQV